MPDQEEFAVTDFSLAVYLTASITTRLVRAEPISAKQVCFVFTPRPECERLATLYASDRALCSPRLILDRARALKSLLHQVKDGRIPGTPPCSA